MKQWTILAAGAALVVMGVAMSWVAVGPPATDPRVGPALGPHLLFGAAHLLVATGMLVTLRTRRPHSWPAWAVWGFTLVTVVASSPIPAGWIAREMAAYTGLTSQNGPLWFLWPIHCLVLAALAGQIVGREADQPAMTVSGLTASAALPVWFWAYYGGLRTTESLGAAPTVSGSPLVVGGLLVAGMAMLAPNVRGRRAERADRSAGRCGEPAPRSRMTIGATLLAAGVTMVAGQLVLWHSCLGWHWTVAEATVAETGCRSAPDSALLETRAVTLHGIGLLLLAAALLWALVASPRRRPDLPAMSPWTRAREVGIDAVWVATAAATAALGVAWMAPSPTVTAVLFLLLVPLQTIWYDPVLFVVLACLVAIDGRGDYPTRWWTLRLSRLFVGLALTNSVVEYFFWTGINASYTTPLFAGLLRALVLVVMGVQLMKAPTMPPARVNPERKRRRGALP